MSAMSAQTRFFVRFLVVSVHISMPLCGLRTDARLRGWRFLGPRMARRCRARAGLLKAAGRRYDHLGQRHLAWGEVRTRCRRLCDSCKAFLDCISAERSQLLTRQWPNLALDQDSESLLSIMVNLHLFRFPWGLRPLDHSLYRDRRRFASSADVRKSLDSFGASTSDR